MTHGECQVYDLITDQFRTWTSKEVVFTNEFSTNMQHKCLMCEMVIIYLAYYFNQSQTRYNITLHPTTSMLTFSPIYSIPICPHQGHILLCLACFMYLFKYLLHVVIVSKSAISSGSTFQISFKNPSRLKTMPFLYYYLGANMPIYASVSTLSTLSFLHSKYK